MENASKALIIAGAILLSILIIAIGIFVFNGANSTITDSMTSMSTQEIEAFNNQFLSYDGKQSGSNVKKLLERLIANASTYKEEPNKIPRVFSSYNKVTPGTNAVRPTSNDITSYVETLGSIRNNIQNKHEYTVLIQFSAGNNGLIDLINIYSNL